MLLTWFWISFRWNPFSVSFSSRAIREISATCVISAPLIKNENTSTPFPCRVRSERTAILLTGVFRFMISPLGQHDETRLESAPVRRRLFQHLADIVDL